MGSDFIQLHLLVEKIKKKCIEGKIMLTAAESCTGGQIAAALTALPGTSQLFERGFVTYSNEAKIEMLGVDAAMIDTYGAVSREVAQAMAQGALRCSRAQISVSVTGIAGPTGATKDKPVGHVHIAVANKQTVEARCYDFGDTGRAMVRDSAAMAALEFIIDFMERNAA